MVREERIGGEFDSEAIHYRPLKQEPDFNAWVDKSNEILKDNEQPYRVVNNTFHSFLIFFFIVIILIMLIYGGILIYQINEGNFKPIITNNLAPLFNASVTSVTNNVNNNTFNNAAEIKAEVIIQKIEIICENGGCFKNSTT